MNRDRSYYQVCQGHYTKLACCYGDEPLCEGHGAVSYCDNTCASAIEQWCEALYNGWVAELDRPVPTMATVTLGFTSCETNASYTVRFEGPDAEAWALAYIDARKATHVVFELAEQPFDGTVFEALERRLYPQCHHGMSADLCMDPYGDNHFGTREQEMAREGW
jgi:hypothetical protein